VGALEKKKKGWQRGSSSKTTCLANVRGLSFNPSAAKKKRKKRKELLITFFKRKHFTFLTPKSFSIYILQIVQSVICYRSQYSNLNLCELQFITKAALAILFQSLRKF
jgi:hypothetical protein